ncbi:2,5-diamino-6-(ribosylamino)-4(3H)-pyrimidinone 5'-phosphate reductase [Pseudogymnoascus destructans]|uniref:2,5-diamino-6-ribosylamino-4(3H)-pyrimidinone 5'-phosphate reductase n=1 Tax=Pseudogymnoascus destructans TaxID=655981 RepID=A0A177A762_9PEZI|nr:2,5-diamino-6-(ribosylamino)-4(3H)-pyrimidinone 5'-phosphate reductase [Pseudogymnoascus destructans]OAF56874.1 2,5-diamino-6-(ribosylamino)-4(3H)-pyrimidinone 5'-phosphate reductase [Pseudogymnoascus destructans]
MNPPPEYLAWSASDFDFLAPHLPPPTSSPSATPCKPHLTLTYATSLDSMLAARPGVRTTLSGPATKTMTHYLRSKHAAILIGAGTALADDPGLNCRLAGAADGEDPLRWQPRPVILDPRGRWKVEGSKVLRLAQEGTARAPWVVTDLAFVDDEKAEALEAVGGAVIALATEEEGEGGGLRFGWGDLLGVLASRGVGSVMVVGQGGLAVAPEKEGEEGAAAELRGAKWVQMGEDVVVCGTLG